MVKDIDGRDHVARHCSSTNINKDGTPQHGAFLIKKEEQFLSVSWVEYFGESSVDKNMIGVREIVGKHRKLKKSGRFAVISVEMARRIIMNKYNKTLAFRDLQELHFPSHSGIYGYGSQDMRVAHTLAEMVGKDDMHPTVCDDV